MASYIKEDVAARIGSGEIAADSLTLQGLSQRYAVSVTPVRAAVKELIQDGVLHKGKNRRLVVNTRRADRLEANGTSSQPEPPKDHYKIILDDLVRLSVREQPVFLREETTARQYGISRWALRQIFNRLAGHGMLKHLPRRGWQLRPLRQTDLEAYLETRVVLELLALRSAWPKLAEEPLQRMLAGNRLPQSRGDRPTIDDSLHAYLVVQASNPYITDFFDRHGKYYEVLFDWEALDGEARIQTVRQHREILAALLRRDLPAAERALANHIRSNHPILQDMIQNQSRGT